MSIAEAYPQPPMAEVVRADVVVLEVDDLVRERAPFDGGVQVRAHENRLVLR